MRRCAENVALLIGMWAALGAAAELKPADGGADSRLGWREIEVRTAPPHPIQNPPAFRSERPLYLSIRLGNGPHPIIAAALDEPQGSDRGYTRLYVDANRNGNLADDPVVRATCTRQERLTSVRAEPFDVTVDYADGSRRTLRMGLRVRGYRRGISQTPLWSGVCQLDQHLEGRIDIGERRNLLIGLYDSSRPPMESNGCFDDYGADRLRIDLNGDGRLDPEEENFPLSRVIALGGLLWNFETDSAARRLKITPCTLPTGTVVFEGACAGGSVELVGGDGRAFKHRLAIGSRLVIPEGEYRASDARPLLSDGAGQLWDAAFTLPAPLNVKRDAVCPVAFGAPFTLDPVIEGQPRLGVGVCISARLTGLGGELYENISRIKTRMEPHVSIIDSESVVVLDEKMEYG